MPITEEGFVERETQFLLGDSLQIAFYNGSFVADTDALMSDVIADELYRTTIPAIDITVTWEDTLNELQHTIVSTFTVTNGFTYNRYGLIKGSVVADGDATPAVSGISPSTTTVDISPTTPASVGFADGIRTVFNGTYTTVATGGISGNVITFDDAIFPGGNAAVTIYNADGVLLFIKEVTPSQTVPNGGDINLNQSGSAVSTC